jgi:protein-S-isoprenylcysteine O-methyltransferase Ste14
MAQRKREFTKKEIRLGLIVAFYATVLIPLVYFINLLLIYFFPDSLKLPIGFRLLGLIATYMGLIIWVISYINLGKSFGVLPRAQKRVKTGLYSLIKHPMYTGISLTFVGLSLANQSVWGLLFTLLITIPLLVIRSKVEEKKLLK